MSKEEIIEDTGFDQLLNTPVRLAIVSSLIKLKQADFAYLLKVTKTTQGNLSHQLKKLATAGYINIIKTFKGNYPHTICELSPAGLKAFEDYVKKIKKMLEL